MVTAILAAPGCYTYQPVPVQTGDRASRLPVDAPAMGLSAEGARVRLLAEPPATCTLLGQVTGVGYAGFAQPVPLDARSGAERPEQAAEIALRNAAGGGGAAAVVIDGDAIFEYTDGNYLALYGRAYRCAPPATQP